MNFIPDHFYTRQDVVIVGRDYEAADYDNPEGWLYGTQDYVIVRNSNGDTYELAVEGNAEQMAERLNARWNNFKKLPVNFSAWSPGRPVYGSEAYIEYGQDEELAWEAKQEDSYNW